MQQAFTAKQLMAMLDDLESDTVERKQSFNSNSVKEKARQAVCAFANDLPNHNRPGVLFIGANDDGSPSNEPINDRLLLSLADIKTDGNILPLPVMDVKKVNLKGSDMAVVTVWPSDMPPVKYDGRIWVRTGSRRSIANEQDERILIERRRHKNLPFDLYPIPIATIEDLSRSIFEIEYLPLAFARDILKANNRSYPERLASCRMIVSPEDTTPTLSGLLALGKSPQDFIPGSGIQFLRINGTMLTDPVVDEELIGGALTEMLRRADEKFRAHNRMMYDVTSNSTHTISTPYPQAAILQMLYNAVMHRVYERTNAPTRVYWYEDRIEIISPGGPYGNVNQDNFGRPGITDYRNPNLGAIMKTLGFVQSFGRGIAITRQLLEQNSNPQLELQVDAGSVIAILRCAL
ncbi:MAG: putative DNA binding domain-containing protein [Clostridiales bacterium]|nr:putative DNA binding domain-containing protein [Clostridiales bacterium]